MSIREWGKIILTHGKIEGLLDILKKAHSQIKDLPLGELTQVDWVFPTNLGAGIKPVPEARLLHSIAHIELMAIYMYWDTLSMVEAPAQFYSDMSAIAIQECTHLSMLIDRLRHIGHDFPYLPFTSYLQELSNKTADDVKARILVTSLYSEGRALDSKERLVKKLRGYNTDHISAMILEQIISDEVSHLKNGVAWFEFFCKEEGIDSKTTHDKLMNKLGLKYRPPFNEILRSTANMPSEWYIS